MTEVNDKLKEEFKKLEEDNEDLELLQKKYDHVYHCYFKSNQLLFYFAGVTVGIIIASCLRGD